MISGMEQFTENMQYDAHGNITGITRRGKISSGSYGLMDNLTLTYDGNRLTGVTEVSADYDFAGSFEYKRANGSQYIYDGNGSLIADKSRGIAYITYDPNGNPSGIYFTNGNITKYVYSATGQKLRVEYDVAVPNTTVTFGEEPDALTQSQTMYAGSRQYLLGGSLVTQDGMIDKFLFDGGYASASMTNPTTYNFSFYYYNRDHLGNNREVVDSAGTVMQITHYYPFGTPYADPSTILNASLQPYKYNGKELDRMHGLDTYDYGARQYAPILGRWDRMDPLCEKYYSISPYAYCGGNPVNRIDPDGRDEWEINSQGQITNRIKTDEHDAFFIVDGDNKRIEDLNISFKYGTVEKSFRSHDKDGDSYDVYRVRGDDNGETLYRFLADNTTVEWSHALFGKEGDRGLNYLITSHQEIWEWGLPDMISKQFRYGYSMRHISHSHPNKSIIPSGLGEGKLDIYFAEYVQSIFGEHVTFSIYIPNYNNSYVPYTPQSTKEDFPVTFPVLHLDPFTVKPQNTQ